jgi:hypothetical protein
MTGSPPGERRHRRRGDRARPLLIIDLPTLLIAVAIGSA